MATISTIPEITGQPVLNNENGHVCDDPTCPCREEFEDSIPSDCPGESEIEAMYDDYSKQQWLSEHL